MVYSYIGLAKPIYAFNNMMLEKQARHRRARLDFLPELEPGGIYSNNIEAASLLAADSDMCVYRTVEELLQKSDIIFVFLSDKSLKTISLVLAKHPVKGKIFCHFSPRYDAGILDFNSGNTYVSMHIPYFIKDKNDQGSVKHIIAEGYGRRLEKFTKALAAMNIPCSLMSGEEKLMYHTATSIVKDLPCILEYTAKRLSKYALASDKELTDDIWALIEENPAALNTYNPVEADDYDYIHRQCEVLKSISLDDITNLYSSLLAIAAKAGEKKENSERIANIAKRTIEKL